MRISDWSSDVCSSDLWYASVSCKKKQAHRIAAYRHNGACEKSPCWKSRHTSPVRFNGAWCRPDVPRRHGRPGALQRQSRSEEHTTELQSLMRNSYAVFCLNKKRHKYTKFEKQN